MDIKKAEKKDHKFYLNYATIINSPTDEDIIFDREPLFIPDIKTFDDLKSYYRCLSLSINFINNYRRKDCALHVPFFAALEDYQSNCSIEGVADILITKENGVSFIFYDGKQFDLPFKQDIFLGKYGNATELHKPFRKYSDLKEEDTWYFQGLILKNFIYYDTKGEEHTIVF